MKYQEGQIVHVKLAGIICEGIIKEVGKSGKYIIQFEGGAEKTVLERHIKPSDNIPPKSGPTSPSRRSPSRRSPARIRSKASPSPPRSLSGKFKSPSPSSVKRSRSRKGSKSPSRTILARDSTPPLRILKVSLENIDASGDYSTLNAIRKRKPVEHVPDTTTENEKLLTVTHDKIIESEKPIFLPIFDEELYETNERVKYVQQTLINDIGKFSDDDEVIAEIKLPTKDLKNESKYLKPPREFGGWFGAFILTLLIPFSVLSVHIFCNKNICSFTNLPNFNEYKILSTYFDVKVFGTYFGYVILLSTLSKIPFVGRKIKNQPNKDKFYVYKMNGLFSAFIIFALLIALESLDISAVNFLIEKYFQFLISSLAIGFLISTLLFIKSRFVPVSLLNPYGSTYNFIYDFFMGRQVNPKVLNIDVKMILFRASYIAALILNSVYLYKSINVSLKNDDLFSFDKISLDPLLLTCAGLQIFYVLDLLLFESQLTTSFELQYEGLGGMKVTLYAAYPFFMTATTKYLYEHNIQSKCNPWLLSAVCFIFFTGYVMYRGSNSQKNAFRLNPYDPALKHLDSMPTGHGKKLIISGWWGLLRHPNYCGDILMHLSIGALCAGSPAGLAVLPPVLMLAVRAARDSNRCRRRYGSSWDRYTQRVRSNIIPFIY